jgi:hypothetical protein
MIRETAARSGGDASPRGNSPDYQAMLPAEAPLSIYEALRSRLEIHQSAQKILILAPKRMPQRPYENSLTNIAHTVTLESNLRIAKSYPQMANSRSPWRLPLPRPGHRIHSPLHPWKLP